MIIDKYHIFITNLDSHTIDLEPYQYGGANITVFRMVDTSSAALAGYAEYVKKLMAEEEKKEGEDAENGEGNGEENGGEENGEENNEENGENENGGEPEEGEPNEDDENKEEGEQPAADEEEEEAGNEENKLFNFSSNAKEKKN